MVGIFSLMVHIAAVLIKNVYLKCTHLIRCVFKVYTSYKKSESPGRPKKFLRRFTILGQKIFIKSFIFPP